MTDVSPKPRRARRTLHVALLAFWLAAPAAHAHEGHEHHERHDEDAPAAAETPLTVRIDHQSSRLEAVATFDSAGLLIWIDDYASNRPLAGLAVNVASNGAHLQATEIEPGTYRVPRDLLHVEGSSVALQFDVRGKDWSEHFDGRLPPPAASAPPSSRGWSFVAGLVLLLVLGAVVGLLARRRRR